MTNYDFTTKEGLEKISRILVPGAFIINDAIKLLKKTLSPEESTKTQVEAVTELIKNGQKEGVKEMKIKVSHGVGIKVKINLEGYPIDLNVGNNADTEIWVKYK